MAHAEAPAQRYIVRVVRSNGLTIATHTCKDADQTVRQMLLQYHAIRTAAKLPFESISDDLLTASLELLPRGESVTWQAPDAQIRASAVNESEYQKHDGKRRIIIAKKAVARLH